MSTFPIKGIYRMRQPLGLTFSIILCVMGVLTQFLAPLMHHLHLSTYQDNAHWHHQLKVRDEELRVTDSLSRCCHHGPANPGHKHDPTCCPVCVAIHNASSVDLPDLGCLFGINLEPQYHCLHTDQRVHPISSFHRPSSRGPPLFV